MAAREANFRTGETRGARHEMSKNEVQRMTVSSVKEIQDSGFSDGRSPVSEARSEHSDSVANDRAEREENPRQSRRQ